MKNKPSNSQRGCSNSCRLRFMSVTGTGATASRFANPAGPTTFLLTRAVVLVWALTVPLFGFSDTYGSSHQHGHDDRDVSDGLSDPGDAEPRHVGPAVETR